MNKETSMSRHLKDLCENIVICAITDALVGSLNNNNTKDIDKLINDDSSDLDKQINYLLDEIIAGLNAKTTNGQSIDDVSDGIEINYNNTKDESILIKMYVENNDEVHHILYSESTDGVNWSECKPIIFIGDVYDDIDNIAVESVVKVGSIYTMLYEITRNNKTTEHYATSTDCLHWEISS